MGKSIVLDLNLVESLCKQGFNDAQIGKRLGVARKVISRRRKKLGIPSISKHHSAWENVDRIRQLLAEGKSGPEVCSILGMSHSTLSAIKKKYDIKSCYETKMSEADIEKAMQMAAEGYTDTEIAKVFNVTDGAIFNHRKSRGVKSLFDYSKISKIDNIKFKELFYQGLTDAEIGKVIGMTSDGIYSHRIRHGYLRESYATAKPKELSYFQKQVLIGTMLGDASFKMGKGMLNPAVTCAHCTKQKEYCEYKTSVFESLGAYCKYHKRSTPDKRNGICYEDYTMFIPSNPELLDWYKAFYPEGKKVIPIGLLSYFTEVSLAFMFMDDGFRTPSSIKIATNCFTVEELGKFQQFLHDKFGVETTLHSDHGLYFKSKSFQTIKSLIEPYMCNSMKYKIE